jgi:hypothetical protein
MYPARPSSARLSRIVCRAWRRGERPSATPTRHRLRVGDWRHGAGRPRRIYTKTRRTTRCFQAAGCTASRPWWPVRSSGASTAGRAALGPPPYSTSRVEKPANGRRATAGPNPVRPYREASWAVASDRLERPGASRRPAVIASGWWFASFEQHRGRRMGSIVRRVSPPCGSRSTRLQCSDRSGRRRAFPPCVQRASDLRRRPYPRFRVWSFRALVCVAERLSATPAGERFSARRT